MSVEHVVVIGASAGGVQALLTLVRELPPDPPVPICIVLHQPRSSPSVLPQLLDRASAATVVHASDGMRLEAGRVYVAPPDRHLYVGVDHLELVHGPLENGSRPAIDPLFRSAAQAYGRHVTAIVLSGSLDDGSAGAAAVARAGGRVVVQDPEEAMYGEMPRNAIRAVGDAAVVVPILAVVDEIIRSAKLIAERDEGSGGDPPRLAGGGAGEVAAPEFGPSPRSGDDQPDLAHAELRAALTCPNCGGPLHEDGAGPAPPDSRGARGAPVGGTRFRCRVGHGWSLDSLYTEQGDAAESALWAAVRVLEERASLCLRLQDRARQRGQTRAVGAFARQAEDAAKHARVIRSSLAELGPRTTGVVAG